MLKQFLVATIFAIAGTGASGQSLCFQIFGAWMIASDGQPLGQIVNEFDSNSLFNEFGSYGSEFSTTSIFNKFGQYGSEFSSLSPFNDFATDPPVLVKDQNVLAYVTTNSSLQPAVHPYSLMTCK